MDDATGGPVPDAGAPGTPPGNPAAVGPRTVEIRSDWTWPAAIAAGLMVVVLMNVVFIWVAVSGADPVVPSYVAEER